MSEALEINVAGRYLLTITDTEGKVPEARMHLDGYILAGIEPVGLVGSSLTKPRIIFHDLTYLGLIMLKGAIEGKFLEAMRRFFMAPPGAPRTLPAQEPKQ